MDADGSCSKGIARALRKLGIKASINKQPSRESFLSKEVLWIMNIWCWTLSAEIILSPRWLPVLGETGSSYQGAQTRDGTYRNK